MGIGGCDEWGCSEQRAGWESVKQTRCLSASGWRDGPSPVSMVTTTPVCVVSVGAAGCVCCWLWDPDAPSRPPLDSSDNGRLPLSDAARDLISLPSNCFTYVNTNTRHTACSAAQDLQSDTAQHMQNATQNLIQSGPNSALAPLVFPCNNEMHPCNSVFSI